MTPFRRNFDREAVDIANGRMPHTRNTERPGTTTSTQVDPANRYIVIAKTDRVLPDPLAFGCHIKPVGGDWYISATRKSELDAIVAMLQRNNIHGILRRLPMR